VDLAATFGDETEPHSELSGLAAAKSIAGGLAACSWLLALDAAPRNHPRAPLTSAAVNALDNWVRSQANIAVLAEPTSASQTSRVPYRDPQPLESHSHEQDSLPNEGHLFRVLDTCSLRLPGLERVHWALRNLASIAAGRQDFASAAEYAEACLSFDDPASPDLEAMLIMAQAYLGLASARVGARVAGAGALGIPPYWAGMPARDLIMTASCMFRRILADDRLRVAQSPGAVRWLASCHAMVAEVQGTMPGSSRLLAAAGVVAETHAAGEWATALDRLGPTSHRSLLALVLASAWMARLDGRPALADRLESLAEQVNWRMDTMEAERRPKTAVIARTPVPAT
jgi:hypothetical protein